MTSRMDILSTGCRFVESTTSTQDEARRWVEQGAPDGSVVVADQQTQGRGRQDRTWLSPPGKNLYLSRVVQGNTDDLRLTPLLGGLVAQRAIAGFLPPDRRAGIKWPNDVWVDGQKVAGILCELLLAPQPTVLLGIGVNLNMEPSDFPGDLRAPATSLGILCGRFVDRQAFLISLLAELDSLQPWLILCPDRLLTLYGERCLTLGQQVRVSIPGNPPFVGRASGLAEDGALLVEEAPGQVRRIEAGDVDLCRICDG